MDTRLLYVLALVTGGAVGLFYYYSGSAPGNDLQLSSGIDFSAKQIRHVQTDDQGELVAELNAASLEHHVKGDRSVLTDTRSIWYRDGKPDAQLIAGMAESTEEGQQVILTQGVQVEQFATPQRGAMRFETDYLVGYPEQKRLETQHSVNITSPQAQLTSQGLNANLDTGEYDFYRIKARYAPHH